MNTNSDAVKFGGWDIEDALLLAYLIKRCNDSLNSDLPKFPLVLQAIGAAVLAKDEELTKHFNDTLSSSEHPPEEVIQRAVEIFQLAVERDLDSPITQRPPEEVEDYPEPDVTLCRQVSEMALQEGRQILQEGDYRFIEVFHLLGWIGLQCDPARLSEFEVSCRTFENEPEVMVQRGSEILEDAFSQGGAEEQTRDNRHSSE